MRLQRWATVAVLGLLAARPSAAQPSCTSPSFATADYAMGTSAIAVATADFDGDGDLDLATADSSTRTVTVRLNDGLGGYSSSPIVFGPYAPPQADLSFLTVADFTNDGKPDLAVADNDGISSRVLVLVNSGTWPTPGFNGPSFTSVAGGGAVVIGVADFDRNGKADIAVAIGSDRVSIRLGQGDGNFNSPATPEVTVGSTPYGLVTGDFDRDGKDDFAVLVEQGTNDYVDVRYGNGDGTFGGPNSVLISASGTHGVEHVVAGDFNRDGRMDLAVAGNDNPMSKLGVYILKGNTSGGFDAPGAGDFFPSGTAAHRIAVGDFNADGAADLAVTNGELLGPPAETKILKGNGDGTFGSPNGIGAEPQPSGAAVGDFNRDGRDDLAVANAGPGNVRVHLNQFQTGPLACANASFGPAGRVFPVAGVNPNPGSLTRADLNNDGRLDLVSTNYGTNSVTVLLATSSGAFAPQTPVGVGTNPNHTGAGDFDNDGDADLAVANSGSNNVSILRNDGTGIFTLVGIPIPLGAGMAPVWVAVADLNADGELDLAVANNAGAKVSILLGNPGPGDLTFAGPSDVPLAGSSPTGVARGEFNGDGRIDLAVSDSSGSKVWLLFGNGSGGFPTTSSFGVGASAPFGLAVANFDGDLDLDVATVNNASNSVSLLLGDGFGNLSADPLSPFSLAPATNPRGIAEADLNGDGRPDVVTSNIGSSNVTVLLKNAGDGFGSATSFGLGGPATGVVIGEFDGDGRLDLAATGGSDANGANIVVLHGNGNGTFAVTPSHAVGDSPVSVTVGDLDRDGLLDLVVPNSVSDNVTILRGLPPDGDFTPLGPPLPAGDGPKQVAIGDFDGNSKPDLAIASSNSNEVVILFGDTFASGTSVPLGPGTDPRSLAAADFDQDGDLDLAVAANGTNQVLILRNTAGSFSVLSSLSVSPQTGPRYVAVGDFDLNGDPDLAVAVFSGKVAVFLGVGGTSANFNAPTFFSAGTQPSSIAVADFNRDGKQDLAVGNEGSTDLTVTLLEGTGVTVPVFNARPAFFVGRRVLDVAAVDFDRNGILDLAIASPNGAAVMVATGNGAFGFSQLRSFGVSAGTWAVASGDFDRNGRPDLAAVTPLPTGEVKTLFNTSCMARRLAVSNEPSACNVPGSPFFQQPVVDVLDDGSNLLKCDTTGTVQATLIGSGFLGGSNNPATVGAIAGQEGKAVFTDLSASDPGRGFRLRFTHIQEGLDAFSRPFSQGLTATISPPGPTNVCQGQPSGPYSTAFGYDRYEWKLDGALSSVTPMVSLPGLAPPDRNLRLDVWQDGCFASDNRLIEVTPSLSGVTINPGTPVTVCSNCTGLTVMEGHTGGDPVTHQWGYRLVSGVGLPNDIPGQTGVNYTVKGPDFPGPGTYYLVVTTTPDCGSPQVSSEVTVNVTTTVTGSAVEFFTVTSKDGKNILEWKNPPLGTGNVVIHRKDGSPNCTFPTSPLAVPTFVTTVPGGPGLKNSYTDEDADIATGGIQPPLPNDVKYCYTVFYDLGGSLYSDGRTNTGRPFDTSGPKKWAFSIGITSLAPPGIGTDAVHVVANDSALYSMTKSAAGGTWPAPWNPVPMNGPSQGRPTSIAITLPGGFSPVIFLSSQDHHVHAFEADTGLPAWPTPADLGTVLLAAPSGMFTAFTGFRDNVMVGNRNLAGSTFYGLDIDDGSIEWQVNAALDGGKIGVIKDQATVDYATRRVYFTSAPQGGPPHDKTVWCLDLTTPTPTACSGWAGVNGGAVVPNVATSATLRGGRLYVGTTDGKVRVLDADTGAILPQIFDTGVIQPIKSLVMIDRTGTDLYVSTNDAVWAFRDDGGPTIPVWSTAVLGASPPVFLVGGSYVYVGSGGIDRKLHRLNKADGFESPSFPIVLGDGSAAVGPPSFDVREGFLYVGTEAGIIYAIQIP